MGFFNYEFLITSRIWFYNKISIYLFQTLSDFWTILLLVLKSCNMSIIWLLVMVFFILVRGKSIWRLVFRKFSSLKVFGCGFGYWGRFDYPSRDWDWKIGHSYTVYYRKPYYYWIVVVLWCLWEKIYLLLCLFVKLFYIGDCEISFKQWNNLRNDILLKWFAKWNTL